ncbi:MAG: atpB [Candidatus Taylorbacteria bacterium]|nr:atpB [Candidatus Taylorbacteria bacterium]
MHISISPEKLFEIGGVAITNAFLTNILVIVLIIVLSAIFYKKIKKVPGRFQALGEIVLEQFMEFMDSFAGGRKNVRKFLPLVATIFFLVLISNWIGTVPGIESIGYYMMEDGHEVFVPFFRTANSDLNMTLALAIIVVIGSHLVGLKHLGRHHFDKFLVNPLKSPIGFFVGILEAIGEISRIVSLTFRLFGNIFAGSVLMLIVTFLVPYVIPVPFLGLELFVGFIQALVFAVLAMMFMAGSTEAHHQEH